MPKDIKWGLLSHSVEYDQKWAKPLGIEVIDPGFGKIKNIRIKCYIYFAIFTMLLLLRKCGLKGLANQFSLSKKIAKYDRVFDLSGDSYKDYSGGFSPYHNAVMAFITSMNIKAYLISQSLGPFRPVNRRWVKKVLNKLSFIYLRETKTEALLKDMGVVTPWKILPDIAFALPFERGPNEACDEFLSKLDYIKSQDQAIVMVSISKLLYDIHSEGYITFMISLLEDIKAKMNPVFALVPHDVKEKEMGGDDVMAIHHFLANCPNQLSESCLAVDFDFDPSFIKQIALRSAFSVAGRMHAGIASLSSNIPCLFISWSHKYSGLAHQVGIENSTAEMSEVSHSNTQELLNKFIESLEFNKNQIEAYNRNAKRDITEFLLEMLKN